MSNTTEEYFVIWRVGGKIALEHLKYRQTEDGDEISGAFYDITAFLASGKRTRKIASLEDLGRRLEPEHVATIDARGLTLEQAAQSIFEDVKRHDHRIATGLSPEPVFR
jgi:hypothetical protein